MTKLNLYTDCDDLLRILNYYYKLNFNEISLHRDMIGYVYFVKSSTKKYVLKLYRHFNTEQALQSIEIIQYLKQNNYPVVSIVFTQHGRYFIELTMPEGKCIGILFDYIDGIEPNRENELASIGRQVGELHEIMSKYPNPLIIRGKEFFIDRYITILREVLYCPLRIKDLEDYGQEVWDRMSGLPHGFCHGDLHTGNMLKTKSNEYILFDFDIASYSHSVIDVAILSDGTNFNNLTEFAYDNTKRTFEKFYQGYSKIITLSDAEISAIFDFIPIRHYELIATITDCQGLDSLSPAFIDEQYGWLMGWKTLNSKI